MPTMIKNGLYILATVGTSFVICRFGFGIQVNNEWLLGAMIVPLVVLMGQSWKKSRVNE